MHFDNFNNDLLVVQTCQGTAVIQVLTIIFHWILDCSKKKSSLTGACMNLMKDTACAY